MTPEAVLKKYWGFSKFRLLQKDIITAILNHNDVLALLPTGGGKSVCYQVPGLLLPGVTLVVSPLISLMKDQVDALVAKNISATYLANTLSKQELRTRIELICLRKYKFIYLSPERLHSKAFISVATQLHISLVVIDEAHCVSLWGDDFRPEYKQVPQILRHLPNRPILAALTATATPRTKKDICESLQLSNPQIFQASFFRNISVSIINVPTRTHHELQLLAYLKHWHNQSGIIYTSSREETERLAHRLEQLAPLLGLGKTGYYHAGLSALERQTTQQLFLEDKLQVLVATTAFGMGIDKPNINFVVHAHPPSSIESYYQEIGRAGRDGSSAEAVLLFFQPHLAIHQGLMEKLLDEKSQQRYASKLSDLLSFVESDSCRIKYILGYFGENSLKCDSCDNCFPIKNHLVNYLHNEVLTAQLDSWRRRIAKTSQLAPSFILTDVQIAYLLLLQPRSLTELKLIPGIGQGWLDTWGRSFAKEWYNTQVKTGTIYQSIYDHTRPDPTV